MSRTLLTGATGLLGSYLLRDALAAGQSIAVLVRPYGSESAEQRVQDLLERFQVEVGFPLDAPTVVEGDLHRPDLGLDEASRSWIKQNCDRIVHCAASLAFHFKAGEPYRSNVDGTRYVLKLCEESGIGDFHLVSTAYVSGRRDGRVMEHDLEHGQEFSCDYERSKFLSEVLLHCSSALDRWAIYRPSVIVGDSGTGYTSSQDGLYAFLRLARLGAERDPEEVLDRLGLSADDGLNLLPVDWVSATITHLLGKAAPAPSVTYHLTNPTPVTPAQIFEAASPFVQGAPRIPVQALDEVLRVYAPYLGNHAQFDRNNTDRDAPNLPCPRLDPPLLEKLIRFVSRREPGRMELALAVGDGATFDLSGARRRAADRL